MDDITEPVGNLSFLLLSYLWLLLSYFRKLADVDICNDIRQWYM